jgi:WhiB family transcriptional regulator, redox-sensing transcriptional regulator
MNEGRVVAMSSWWMGWQHRAACRGEVAAWFFPEAPEESREDRREREGRAKAICAACPVKDECLEYSLRTREPHGVWGGLNEYERRARIRERAAAERAAG